MATKAIAERVANKKPLTKAQKIKVLKDARKLIENPENWVKGSWDIVDDENYEKDTRRMCVLGAVAVALGNDKVEKSPDTACAQIANCSLATSLFDALPGGGPTEEAILDHWYESDDGDEWIFEQTGVYPCDQELSDEQRAKLFKSHLKEIKSTALGWYVDYAGSDALNDIYSYNDRSSTTHADILKLLDDAIAKLSA